MSRASGVDEFRTRTSRYLYLARSRRLIALDDESASIWDRCRTPVDASTLGASRRLRRLIQCGVIQRRKPEDCQRPVRGEWTFYERVETVDAILKVARDGWLSGILDFVHVGPRADDLLSTGAARLPQSRWMKVAVSRLRPVHAAAAIVPMELLSDCSADQLETLRSALDGFAFIISYTTTRDWLSIGELAVKVGVSIADSNGRGRAAVIRFPG